MLGPERPPVLHNGRCGEGEGEAFPADELVLTSNCNRTVHNRYVFSRCRRKPFGLAPITWWGGRAEGNLASYIGFASRRSYRCLGLKRLPRLGDRLRSLSTPTVRRLQKELQSCVM